MSNRKFLTNNASIGFLNIPPRLNTAIKLRIFLTATTTDYPYESIMTVGAILYGCPQSFMVARHDMAVPRLNRCSVHVIVPITRIS